MSVDGQRLLSSIKPLFWRSRYAAWEPRRRSSPVRRGYSVLVPVPGDIGVLTDVALDVLSRQDSTHRIETLVIPDMRSSDVNVAVERRAHNWDGPLRVVDLAAPERLLLPRLGDPGKNHPAQLLRGISQARASHVIFHDADLFPLDEHLHERTWAVCDDPSVDVVGLEGPWDPWFNSHGRELAATWEMCCKVEWMRSFAPWRHFAHEAAVGNERHVFDTTFWPQWSTAQDRLRTIEASDQYIHFNYVISTYRKFQHSAGPFRDKSFRLLLLRMLIDLFDTSGRPTPIPSMEDLVRGLDNPQARVYFAVEDAAEFRAMASKLTTILEGPWSGNAGATLSDRMRSFAEWAR